MSFEFTIEATDGRARSGTFTTPHGNVETPTFMPVGTLGTVKALDPRDLKEAGVSMLLANAYHMHLRPGDEIVRSLGGIHAFMGWEGPVLTDSGGFQVFSLATLRRVSEEGVEFQSHIDGSRRHFSPESVIRIQRNIGADVIMQFDHVIPGQADQAAARDASERSLRWLTRCRDEFDRLNRDRHERAPTQALFPIVQGGIHRELRQEAVAAITSTGSWYGFGIGGLSVGEPKPAMYDTIEVVDAVLPHDRPRYLMGIGFPEDLI
jgi:queuine tRNA-ribosyltransferase